MTSQTHPQEVPDLVEHIREQIAHVEQRIADGKELGATVWRLALEDVARENRAILAALQQSRSTPGAGDIKVCAAFMEGLRSGWNAGRAGEEMDYEYAAKSWEASDAAAALAASPVPVDAGEVGELRVLLARCERMLDGIGQRGKLLDDVRAALHAAPAPVAGPGHAERICRTAAAWEMEQAARPGIGKKSADCHRSAAMALEMAADDIAKLKTHPASENRHDG